MESGDSRERSHSHASGRGYGQRAIPTLKESLAGEICGSPITLQRAPEARARAAREPDVG
jgi:hypothetical protein